MPFVGSFLALDKFFRQSLPFRYGRLGLFSRQGKSGFTGQIGPFKLGKVFQIVNLANRGRFGNPDIDESETVDGEQLAFTLEPQQPLAPANPHR